MRWCADRRRRRRPLAVGRLAPAVAAITVLVGPGAAFGQATTWAPGAALEARVRAAVAERWGIQSATVRLEWGQVREPRSIPADAPLRLIGSGAGGSWVVAFEPPGEPPLHVRVRAGTEVERPVAARDLERDVVLAEGDIAYRPTIEWGAPRPVTPVRPGWVTRRRIALGQALEEPAVGPPVVVRAGEPVRAVLTRGAITLALDAIALGNAAIGEKVAFRTDSGRRLVGIAAGPSLIHISDNPGRDP